MGRLGYPILDSKDLETLRSTITIILAKILIYYYYVLLNVKYIVYFSSNNFQMIMKSPKLISSIAFTPIYEQLSGVSVDAKDT